MKDAKGNKGMTELSERGFTMKMFILFWRLFSKADCTGRMGWMAHRKWKECKQQPGTAGSGNMLGCCLIYFHFLWAIHPIRPVVLYLMYDAAAEAHHNRPHPGVSDRLSTVGE